MVGVPLDDVGAILDAGSVYVFEGAGVLMGSMDNPEAGAGDHFGAYLLMNSSGYVAVGAPDDDPDPGSGAVLNAGSVYITRP